MGLGAYFAYVRHPFALAAPDTGAGAGHARPALLMLPGTMFRPAGEPEGSRELRIAFANADRAGIATLFRPARRR